jgi:hypothetical protein
VVQANVVEKEVKDFSQGQSLSQSHEGGMTISKTNFVGQL